MSQYETAPVLAHLTQKWANRPCPMCEKTAWSIEGSSFELREFNHGNMIVGGPVIPIIPVVCTNCGNTVLVNAILAGAVERAGQR
jgi:hypothetical protein